MESKPADVFAFAMVVVEVFTGKLPFEGQKDEAVLLRILEGGRPEMPRNAQVVGFTEEMWKLLEACWQQNPKKRPTMKEVVRRWRKFVEHDDDNDVVTGFFFFEFWFYCDEAVKPILRITYCEVRSGGMDMKYMRF